LALATAFGASVERGWTTLIVAILFIGGLQLVMLGVVGEYVGKVYDEVRNRPTFIIADEMGAWAERENASDRRLTQ
jgi:dolichol-phosphate mannosyltransferase